MTLSFLNAYRFTQLVLILREIFVYLRYLYKNFNGTALGVHKKTSVFIIFSPILFCGNKSCKNHSFGIKVLFSLYLIYNYSCSYSNQNASTARVRISVQFVPCSLCSTSVRSSSTPPPIHGVIKTPTYILFNQNTNLCMVE